MTKLIARREELKQLKASTNGFRDIADCKSLEDYEKLIKKVNTVIGFNKNITKGIIFGEPFFNFFFIEHGPTLNVDFVRMATKDEDKNDGFDTLLINRLTGQFCRCNGKMFSAFKDVTMDDAAGLGWSAAVIDRDWVVMIITTANSLSIALNTKLVAADGKVLLRIDIEPLVKQKTFWERFAEYFLIKHPDRIRLLGEVFTPTPLVLRVLRRLPDFVWKEGEPFLDPTCGNGQFLAAVLIIKISLGHTDALSTIYGVDIMQDNVDECRQRLLDIAGDTPENRAIVEHNILCKDGLTYDYSFGDSPTEQLGIGDATAPTKVEKPKQEEVETTMGDLFG